LNKVLMNQAFEDIMQMLGLKEEHFGETLPKEDILAYYRANFQITPEETSARYYLLSGHSIIELMITNKIIAVVIRKLEIEMLDSMYSITHKSSTEVTIKGVQLKLKSEDKPMEIPQPAEKEQNEQYKKFIAELKNHL
jgi:hypothetical protein